MALPIAEKSSRFETSSSPQSPEQWKRALQSVKLLYVQRQYKQCAARSFAILYFYSAICHEEMGRAAHNYSRRKIPMLNSALDCFVTCSAVLSTAVPIEMDPESESASPVSLADLSTASDFSDSPSPDDSLLTSITEIIDKSLLCPDDDPFVSDGEDWIEPRITLPKKLPPRIPADDHKLMPSPLQIRKSSAELRHADKGKMAGQQIPPAKSRRAPPPPLPIKIVPAGDKAARAMTVSTPRNQGPGRSKRECIPISPSHADAIRRYNSSLLALRAQTNSSIADIHALIDEIAELQSARRASKSIRRSCSFWSFSPVGEETPGSSGRAIVKETKEQRIARLRAEGWKTVGLRSPVRGWKGAAYYQAYCASVLDELYLGG